MSWDTLIKTGLLDAPPTTEQVEEAALSDEDMKLLLTFWTPEKRATPMRKSAVYARPLARAGAVYARDFNPSQPRDDHGRWSDGGSGDSTKPEHAGEVKPSLGGTKRDYLGPVDVSKVEVNPSLTGRDAEVQASLARQIAADPRAAWEEYKKLPSTENGFIIAGDDAKELSADYRADRSAYANAVHEPSSWLTKQAYKEELSKPLVPGKSDVMFMAGGTGAGKTSSIRTAVGDSAFSHVQTVYDSNMAKAESGWKKIDAALETGRGVTINYVDRDPEVAFEAAMTRAMKPDSSGKPYGRTLPIDAHIRTHTGARATVERTIERYKNDPRVRVNLIDNNGKFGEAKLVNAVGQLRQYNYTGLEDRLRARLERAHTEGRINDKVYQGFKKHERGGD